jgi:hypothetical protein
MEKVAPSERFRRELDEVLAGVGGEEDPIETVEQAEGSDATLMKVENVERQAVEFWRSTLDLLR